jgi:hypothetical protein
MTPIFTSKTLTLTILGLSTLSFAGCSKNTEHAKPSPNMPEVTLVKAETRNILRTVGQPGFVEASFLRSRALSKNGTSILATKLKKIRFLLPSLSLN